MPEYIRIKESTLRRFGENARRLGKVYNEMTPDEMIAIFENIDDTKILGENQYSYSVGSANSDWYKKVTIAHQSAATASIT